MPPCQENVRQLKHEEHESSNPPVENTASTIQSPMSSRDKAMVNAGVASPILKRLERLDSLETKIRSPTATEDTSWESRIGVDGHSKSDAIYASAAKQLRELKYIHDSLSVEADSKEKKLHELQSTTKSREADDTRIHRRITVGQKSIVAFQNRLDQLEGLMDTASHVERVYNDILLKLHTCDPTNQSQHIQLEEQIHLSRQQIADLQKEGVRKTKDIERTEARSKKFSEDVKSILRERQSIKPRLEMLQTQVNEQQNKDTRNASFFTRTFDPATFSKRVLLEGRIARRRETKLKRVAIATFSSEEITKVVKLHPMERLAEVSGTRDPVSIAEILNEDETQQLRTRQEQGELQLKDQAATLESLSKKIKNISLVDGNAVSIPSVACEDAANIEAGLLVKQKRLDSITQLIKHISQVVVNLNDMVQSGQGVLTDVARFAVGAADPQKHVKWHGDVKHLSKLLGSLHRQIPSKYKENEPRKATRYQNIRILNRAEQESQAATATKQLEEDREDEDDDDCVQDVNEDFGKLASYVSQGINTNASQNQQRRANLVSKAKQGRYAHKGIILEAVMQSASSKNSSP